MKIATRYLALCLGILLLTTSCLGDDEEIVYTSDCALLTFSLGNITYKYPARNPASADCVPSLSSCPVFSFSLLYHAFMNKERQYKKVHQHPMQNANALL